MTMFEEVYQMLHRTCPLHWDVLRWRYLLVGLIIYAGYQWIKDKKHRRDDFIHGMMQLAGFGGMVLVAIHALAVRGLLNAFTFEQHSFPYYIVLVSYLTASAAYYALGLALIFSGLKVALFRKLLEHPKRTRDFHKRFGPWCVTAAIASLAMLLPL